jgi:hypothetical protein
MLNYSIHARERVTELVPEKDLDRMAHLACVAAEAPQGWQPGEEFVFEIEKEGYDHPGMESSALVVCHKGANHEVFYNDGPMAETISANRSWDRDNRLPPSGA